MMTTKMAARGNSGIMVARMRRLNKARNNIMTPEWSLRDTYGFIARFLRPSPISNMTKLASARDQHRLYCTLEQKPPNHGVQNNKPMQWQASFVNNHQTRRSFHDYFVTHLPSSSHHPDSRSGPHHNLPRSASTPHTSGQPGPQPAALPPMAGTTRELTVVRIPLRSAKHHFGVGVSRGSRPYNEDTHQAGTVAIPAFAKRAPVSLSRTGSKVEATAADGENGDPQVFYFGVFDGHGGSECSQWLREELHTYVEDAAGQFELESSLMSRKEKERKTGGVRKVRAGKGHLATRGEKALDDVPVKGEAEVKEMLDAKEEQDAAHPPAVQGEDPISANSNTSKAVELQRSLIAQWKETVGGYFRRFKPEHFALPTSSSCSDPSTSSATDTPSPVVSLESVLMYAFLRADFDFITAQARKPDPTAQDHHSDAPLNADEILGEPSYKLKHEHGIGGPTRFVGGSTASIALISTPTPTPFWHPASPSTLIAAHVGDTRIILCDTATGLAVPLTTNHHPSAPVEGTRLRRYAATFVTDSFGEERMSGLANTRAFGDMRSKRIGVSAEPEITRLELAPAQYSFLVLVSDGVSGSLTDQEIVDVVKEQRTPEQAAAEVVGLAGDVGDGDNATVLVVRLGGWERRLEGGGGGLRTKESREWKRNEALDPRRGRR